MKVKNELRKLQKAITDNFKYHAEKAEKILGAIENCEKTIAALSESLSAKLGLGVKTTAVAATAPRAIAAKVKLAKVTTVKLAVKPTAGPSQRDSVRDFMLKAGKPMRIAEIVTAMHKAGHVFQSRKPVKAMKKLLYTNKQMFKRVKPGTFKAV